MFDIEVNRMLQFHEEKNALATLLVHPNSHPQDSDLVVLDTDGRVIGFDSKNNIRDYWFDNCVNAGIYAVGERKVYDAVFCTESNSGFCRIFGQCVKSASLSAGKQHSHTLLFLEH